jgi:hypothetical protein
MVAGLGTTPGMAQSRAHVYLLRGLMNTFSLGMDTLAEKIQHRGIYATVHNYSEWQTLADHAAAAYHAGTEGERRPGVEHAVTSQVRRWLMPALFDAGSIGRAIACSDSPAAIPKSAENDAAIHRA